MRMVLAVAVVAVLPVVAAADEFPTDPEQKDKFCEAIGETPNVAVPPRERMWFKENCLCQDGVGCGFVGSARLNARMKQHLEELQALTRARAQKAAATTAARKAAAARVDALRAKFWKCWERPDHMDACDRELVALEAACTVAGLDFEWDSAPDGMRPSGRCYEPKPK